METGNRKYLWVHETFTHYLERNLFDGINKPKKKKKYLFLCLKKDFEPVSFFQTRKRFVNALLFKILFFTFRRRQTLKLYFVKSIPPI